LLLYSDETVKVASVMANGMKIPIDKTRLSRKKNNTVVPYVIRSPWKWRICKLTRLNPRI